MKNQSLHFFIWIFYLNQSIQNVVLKLNTNVFFSKWAQRISQNVNKSVKRRKKHLRHNSNSPTLDMMIYPHFLGKGNWVCSTQKWERGITIIFQSRWWHLFIKKTSASPISNYSPGAIFYGTLGTQFELQSRN